MKKTQMVIQANRIVLGKTKFKSVEPFVRLASQTYRKADKNGHNIVLTL